MEASFELRSPGADGLQFPLEQIVIQIDLALELLPVDGSTGETCCRRWLTLLKDRNQY